MRIEALAPGPCEQSTWTRWLARRWMCKQMVAREPTQARDALRGYFANGRIELQPQPEGHYVAETQLLPLVRVTKEQRPREGA